MFSSGIKSNSHFCGLLRGTLFNSFLLPLPNPHILSPDWCFFCAEHLTKTVSGQFAPFFTVSGHSGILHFASIVRWYLCRYTKTPKRQSSPWQGVAPMLVLWGGVCSGITLLLWSSNSPWLLASWLPPWETAHHFILFSFPDGFPEALAMSSWRGNFPKPG